MQVKQSEYIPSPYFICFLGRFLLTAPKFFSLIVTIIISFSLITPSFSYSQVRRIVAIGSSTTAGIGASSIDSSWTGLLNSYYTTRFGITDSIYNLGVPGADVYNGMPTGYVSPPGRSAPDVNHNITKAFAILQNLTYAADGAIIVNYPSNGYNSFSMEEIMTSLQTIYDAATADGYTCFITTTQPRCDAPFAGSDIKKKLADIKDSIISRFGEAHTINFWDGMFNPADTTILPAYSSGDNIHFNNAGHRELYKRVLAKNMFNLSFWFSKATGKLNSLTTWCRNADGTGSSPQSFIGDDAIYTITRNATVDGDWTITGNRVKLIVGGGTVPVNFTIPANFKVSVISPLQIPHGPRFKR